MGAQRVPGTARRVEVRAAPFAERYGAGNDSALQAIESAGMGLAATHAGDVVVPVRNH